VIRAGRTLLVGGGIPPEEFLSRPVVDWLKPSKMEKP
jgi:hypothetical protein